MKAKQHKQLTKVIKTFSSKFNNKDEKKVTKIMTKINSNQSTIVKSYDKNIKVIKELLNILYKYK